MGVRTATRRRARSVPRTAALLRALLLAALLATGFSALAASPAQAATIDCPNQASDACKNTVPVVDCAWNNGDGTTSFVWGWDNPSSDTAHAVAGSAQNKLTPAGSTTQPELFGPGRHTNAFWVVVSGDTSTWRLGNTSVTAVRGAGGNTPACATKPVPQVGSVGVLIVLVLLLGMAALLVVATRPRRRPLEVR